MVKFQILFLYILVKKKKKKQKKTKENEEHKKLKLLENLAFYIIYTAKDKKVNQQSKLKK